MVINYVFISYRRDDSAGHAGRLFDRLKDRLGADHVFMDVTDLQPGQDFAVELENAVAKANCLLAVIGPRWLGAVDASGRRRIEDPDDFVRREVGAALSNGASVIPVLVHGATMPRADELPAALRALARRQAFTLSDQHWASDLVEFVQFLSAQGDAAAVVSESGATKAARGRGRTIGAVALAVLTLLAGGAWMAFQASNRSTQTTASRPSEADGPRSDNRPATTVPVVPQRAPTVAPTQRFLVALPSVSEVQFRNRRAQVVFTIMAIRQEARAPDTQILTFLVRMLNHGPSDEAFGSHQFRLIAGDQTIVPTNTLISSVEATASKESSLHFLLPNNVADTALEVRMGEESTRMPIALSARSPIPDDAALDSFGRTRPARLVDSLKVFPATLAAGQIAEVGKVDYRITAVVIERQTVEKASITISVRCSAPRGGGGVSFGTNAVRLWVDGVPRAPVNAVNGAVDPGDSKEAPFVFDLVEMPQTLEVSLHNGADSARFPLPLMPLTRR